MDKGMTKHPEKLKEPRQPSTLGNIRSQGLLPCVHTRTVRKEQQCSAISMLISFFLPCDLSFQNLKSLIFKFVEWITHHDLTG